MKRAAIPICLLAILLLFTSTVAADSPWETREFTISGTTTSMVPMEQVPDGKIGFRITAEGTVSGDIFDGDSFSFTEWVIADPETYEASNVGLLTIMGNNGSVGQNCDQQPFGDVRCDQPSKAVIQFSGTADIFQVSGRFRVLSGWGEYYNIQGLGTYDGIPDFCPNLQDLTTCTGFWVEFAGRFRTRD